MSDTPEWLRLARGWPCWLLVRVTPVSVMWLLPSWVLGYAGDWIYRRDRRAAREDSA